MSGKTQVIRSSLAKVSPAAPGGAIQCTQVARTHADHPRFVHHGEYVHSHRRQHHGGVYTHTHQHGGGGKTHAHPVEFWREQEAQYAARMAQLAF
jgi:hypothetical protein